MSLAPTWTTSSMNGAAVARLVAGDAGERRAPGVHPVVAVLARHDDPLLRPAQDVPVAARELGGRVDRVRAARAEEDDGVLDRRERGQAVRELDGRLGRVRPRTTSTPGAGPAARRRRRRSRAGRSPRCSTRAPRSRRGSRRPSVDSSQTPSPERMTSSASLTVCMSAKPCQKVVVMRSMVVACPSGHPAGPTRVEPPPLTSSGGMVLLGGAGLDGRPPWL